MDRKLIDNISTRTEQAIKRKSAFGLPDRPSESGMRSDEIKKAFYSSITDGNDSVLSEMKRVVNEINEILGKIQENLEEKMSNEQAEAVGFAESERQKSKNLFDLSRVKFSSSVNVNLSNNSFTFTAFSTYTSNKLKDFADLEVGKTYRLIGTTTSSNKAVYLPSVSQYWYFNNTITITQEILDSTVGFYGKTDVAVTISELMITEGTNEESYQPYNGETIREKQLRERSMTAVGNVYLSNNNTTSITFDNINCQDGDIFRLVVRGATAYANDGTIVFDGITAGYAMIELSAYQDGGTASSNYHSSCPFRTDTQGFFVEMTFGATSVNNGSFVWVDNKTYSVQKSNDLTRFFKHIQGVLPDHSSVNQITINSPNAFLEGTCATLYKVGTKA